MNDRKIFNALKPCLPFYFLAMLLILGMKYGYGKADGEELLWILAPTCWWVRFLSGIPFQWVPDVGYVSHSARFIIAKSCSGVQFMMVSIAALVFSFLHRKKTLGQAVRWMLEAAGISYLYTIFVNGLRILMSIYLPRLFNGLIFPAGWLTKERLHSIIGIAVYFTALFILYQLADQKTQPVAQKAHSSAQKMQPADQKAHLADQKAYSSAQKTQPADQKAHLAAQKTQPADQKAHLAAQKTQPADQKAQPVGQKITRMGLNRYLMPLFWYFFMVLGLPFLNGAAWANRQGFFGYARLIALVCLSLVLLFNLFRLLAKRVFPKLSNFLKLSKCFSPTASPGAKKPPQDP